MTAIQCWTCWCSGAASIRQRSGGGRCAIQPVDANRQPLWFDIPEALHSNVFQLDANGAIADKSTEDLQSTTMTWGSGRVTASLTGAPGRLNALRARFPVRFAAAVGLLIAVIGLVSGGATFGSGSEAVKGLLAGNGELNPLQTLLKFIATWLTAWCGVPGGIFAPSLTIGAGIGEGLSQLAGPALRPALIAMGMAGFLAAVTQAPLTAFIIVMEMVDGHAMVLSLMACAMGASLVARMISRPLYEVLAEHMVAQAIGAPPRPRHEQPAEAEDAPRVP